MKIKKPNNNNSIQTKLTVAPQSYNSTERISFAANVGCKGPPHSLGVVGVGATETLATARLPGTRTASRGWDRL